MSNRLVETKREMQLAGSLLVASPSHPQSQFSNTVFLVTWHAAEGTIGVLLNRPLEADLGALWGHLWGKSTQNVSNGVVHYGGPLAGPVLALHRRPDLAEVEPAPGIYVAAQLTTLRRLLVVPAAECRWIVGHAAWNGIELEKQIQAGWWYPIPATPDLVFSAADELWSRGVRRAGDLSLAILTGCPPVPGSAVWN